LGGAGAAETQCFAYDGHRRLTQAWTPASQDCAAARDAGSLSGPAPYWTSYTYNKAGQRTSETQHTTAGAAKTTYCYTDSVQPHTLSGTSTTADCAAPDRTYTYDAAGNTTKRPGESDPQHLTWSPEGKLAELTEGDTSTDYLYDTDGTLLIRNTSDGERILYAGASEVHLRADGTMWAQRHYTTPEGETTLAVRTNESGTNKLTYLAADHHGTSHLAITADDTQDFTKRYTSPFGSDRGTPTGAQAWPDDKGFLGKTRDTTTGLTHIGAREYDPTLGQFISVDPILSLDQPQSLNGYSYANQHPTTSDPTGMRETCGAYTVDCRGGGPASGGGGGAPCPSLTDPQCPEYQSGSSGNDGGTVTISSTGTTTNSDQVCSIKDGNCAYNLGPSDPGTFGNILYGLVSNLAYTAELAGWIFDGDCRNGGAGTPGCDYGAQFDAWVAAQGYDVNSDAYLVPSFLAALFFHKDNGGGVPRRKPATVSTSATNNYKSTFFKAYPHLKGKVIVHHAVEQQVLKKYPGLFAKSEINSIDNLRGIPKSANPDLHLSRIRVLWNGFYKTNSAPTRKQVLDYATFVDDFVGGEFDPRIR
ncbi:RHS repeat-associated core domain-containing protein, partial [Streptomyces sp. NPDC002845]